MPFTTLQLKHRSEWQRDYLEKRYRSTGGSVPRQSPFAASREHHTRLGFTIRAWQPVHPTDNPSGMDTGTGQAPLAATGSPSTGNLDSTGD